MVTVNGIRTRFSAAAQSLLAPTTAVSDRDIRDDSAMAPSISAQSPWWDLFPFSAHRIKLASDIYTADDGTDAETDLRTETVVAHAGGSIDGLTIIDLGCLEGAFAIEFAKRGAARVVGVEARALNARRSEVASSLLGLKNVSIREGEVSQVLKSSQDEYDVVFASGILYHLAEPAAFLVRARRACHGFALIDTHVADPVTPFKDCSNDIVEHVFQEKTYRGRMFWEFDPDAAEADRSQMLWAAWDNPESFWPLEEDLVRMILDAGFREAIKVDTSGATDRWRVDPRSRVMYVCRV